MDNINYNKFISFIVSICLYILLLLIILLYIKEPKVKKYNSKIKETIIEIDLVEVSKEQNKQVNNKPKIQKIIIKKTTSNDSKVKSNLKSLFANVKTKAIKINKNKILNVKDNKIQSRFKSKYKNNVKTEEIKISKLKNIKKEKINNEINSENNDIFDEYYSQIKLIILTRWYKNPIYNTNSYLIKVYININTKGQFNFNIIRYSGNVEIDNILNSFLNKQKMIKYPVSKDKKSKTILINFMNEKG